jgi:type IV secretory pathway VirD2 relaxase
VSAPRDREFRPRLRGPAKDRHPTKPFVQKVLSAHRKCGGRFKVRAHGTGSPKRASGRPGARFGRGHVAARLARASHGARSRRVIIKSRTVILKQASARTTSIHLRYLQRDAVSRTGGRGELYGPEGTSIDAAEFEARGQENRHQFRFIVSPEDAIALEDLPTFTRTLMRQMEADLGTRLEWVAADHWDTDNPHIHIVVRGIDQNGDDLLIASDYLSRGMRIQASEIATQWLGPRTELEIRQSRAREVEAERYTSIDRNLEQRIRDHVIDLAHRPPSVEAQQERALLIGRLDRLHRMGLANPLDRDVWQVSPDLKDTLTRMGERGDIIRTLQRAFAGQVRDYEIYDPRTQSPVTGRLVGRGLADELTGKAYVVVDGVEGLAHYVRVGSEVDVADLPLGSIVRVSAPAVGRAADHNILQIAREGVYRTAEHLERARNVGVGRYEPEEFVRSHVRRLEALRRAGIVERLEEGVWRVSADLVERAQAYDRSRISGAALEVRSYVPLERQTRVIGATWLDQQFGVGESALGLKGFGAEVRTALQVRQEFLVDQGLLSRDRPSERLTRQTLDQLRARELESAGGALSQETGLTYRAALDGERVSGTYQRSINLASGRFAMLDDGLGFTLVPWRPLIEPRRGQELTALVHGEHVSWTFGRQRGLSR